MQYRFKDGDFKSILNESNHLWYDFIYDPFFWKHI